MGLGIDIVQLSRIKDCDALAKKILSSPEMENYLKSSNKLSFIGGRWAAKEAFLKAVGVGIFNKGTILFNEISILNEESGKPILIYKDKKYDVSISHEKEYAVAICNYE